MYTGRSRPSRATLARACPAGALTAGGQVRCDMHSLAVHLEIEGWAGPRAAGKGGRDAAAGVIGS